MAVSYRIDPAQRCAYFILSGDVSGDALVRISQEAACDPLWDPSYERIWDGRAIQVLGQDLRDVQELAEEIRDGWADGARMVLVMLREMDLIIARLLQIYLRPCEVEVITQMQRAAGVYEERI